jgi:hypothetical protein
VFYYPLYPTIGGRDSGSRATGGWAKRMGAKSLHVLRVPHGPQQPRERRDSDLPLPRMASLAPSLTPGNAAKIFSRWSARPDLRF